MNATLKNRIIAGLAALILGLTVTGCGKAVSDSAPVSEKLSGKTEDSAQASSKQPSSGQDGKTVEEMIAANRGPEIEIGEDTYVINKNVESYLVLGIDKSEEAGQSENLIAGGQCDTIMLVVLDNGAKEVTVLQLNRDTITDVSTLDPWGKPAHTQKMHLALAHGYGDGMASSCENVVRSVKALLGESIPVNGYASLNMGALGPINDAAGGVEVTIEEDMTNVDPAFEKGASVLLSGAQAEAFIRARMSVGQGTNAERLARQRTYMNAFTASVRSQMKEKSNIIDQIYNAAKPYLITDMGWDKISKVAANGLVYSNKGFVNLPGEYTRGDTYGNGKIFAEFYPDPEALQQIVLDLFYVKIKK